MALNRNQAVLQAIVNRVQELENAAWVLLQNMAITIATGDLLNKYGAIVGEQRLGRSVADYQAGIKLKIRTNISSGRAVDVLAVAILAYAPSSPSYSEGYPAAWVLDMPLLPSPQYVAQKLGHARAAGTYGLLQFTVPSALPTFFLDSVSGGVTSPGLMDSVSGGVASPAQMSAALMV